MLRFKKLQFFREMLDSNCEVINITLKMPMFEAGASPSKYRLSATQANRFPVKFACKPSGLGSIRVISMCNCTTISVHIVSGASLNFNDSGSREYYFKDLGHAPVICTKGITPPPPPPLF